MAADDLELQRGTRLLHIGPHKTGSSALQSALHLARERLAAHGVVYPGRGRQTLWPILAVTGQPALLGEPAPKMAYWDYLARAVRAAGDQRVIVSSEFFSEAGDAAVARIIGDLGGQAVHVVATLRPLARILPSQWQQYLQNGFRMSYGEWLAGILSEPPSTPTPGFWRRHRHDELVRRWAAVAGLGNVTVVVVEDSDRRMLLRTFEAMLGLPEGFLVPEDEAENRSLTMAEAELLRRLNHEFKRQQWPDRSYAAYMRYGAIQQLKAGRQAGPGEPRIVTPLWALERAAGLGSEMAGKIAALGVRVVGDLSALGAHQPAPPPRAPAGSARIPARPNPAGTGEIVTLIPTQAGRAAPARLVPARATVTAGQAPRPAFAQAESPVADIGLIPAEAAIQAIIGAFQAGGVAGRTAEESVAELSTASLARLLVQRGRQRARAILGRRRG